MEGDNDCFFFFLNHRCFIYSPKHYWLFFFHLYLTIAAILICYILEEKIKYNYSNNLHIKYYYNCDVKRKWKNIWIHEFRKSREIMC